MLQPGGLLHAGYHVPGGDLLPPLDVDLGPDLHHLGLGVDVVHGVAVAVAVHQRIHPIQSCARSIIALGQATNIIEVDIKYFPESAPPFTWLGLGFLRAGPRGLGGLLLAPPGLGGRCEKNIF